MKLSDLKIRKLRPESRPQKYADGEGLLLRVTPHGGKHWKLAYRFDGKQKELSFGSYPAVSLKRARELRDEAKAAIAGGKDPSLIKRQERRQQRSQRIATFETLGREWHQRQSPGWSPRYAALILSRMEEDLFPEIGERAVDAIEPPEMLAVIRKIEDRTVDTARRVNTYASSIFRYAIAIGMATRDPTQDIKGALQARPPVKHSPSLKAKEIPEFMGRLARYDGDRRTLLGLRLIIYTFVRTRELRFARWSEIEDLGGSKPLWRIPADRMKMKSDHIVPLAPQAVGILDQLSIDSDLIFTANTVSGVMSENTLLFAVYRMGYHSRLTVHGFRGTASTILNESGLFSPDWIEKQLAHEDRNKVRSAYNAAQYLEHRRIMMCWWADYIDAQERKGRELHELIG